MLEFYGVSGSVALRAEIGSGINREPKSKYPMVERRRTPGVMQKRTGFVLRLRRTETNFERLVRPHLDHLYRLAYRFTGTSDRAEDLIQDLLVRVYPRCAELAQIEQPRPWLARIMYRIFIDQFRRNSRAPFVPMAERDADNSDEDGDGGQFADPAPGPEVEVELNLEREHLLRAWEHLSAEHRVLIALHDVEGYTLNELESVLSVTRGTLKSRLSRARARLADLLARERFEPVVRVQRHSRN